MAADTDVELMVRQLDYLIDKLGEDHVGLGSDFDGVQITTNGLATVADLPNLTKELLSRGYTETQIDKILGGNMLRVMDAMKK